MANFPYPGHILSGQVLSGVVDWAAMGPAGYQIGTAHDTIAAGDPVYQVRTGGRGYARAVATATGTMPAIGVAEAAAVSGASVRVIVSPGQVNVSGYNYSGHHGEDLWVPAAVGSPVTADPTTSGQYAQVIGFVVDTDSIYFRPGPMHQKGGGVW